MHAQTLAECSAGNHLSLSQQGLLSGDDSECPARLRKRLCMNEKRCGRSDWMNEIKCEWRVYMGEAR